MFYNTFYNTCHDVNVRGNPTFSTCSFSSTKRFVLPVCLVLSCLPFIFKIHDIICHSCTDLQKMERWIDRRMDEKFRPFSNPYPNIAVKIRWAAARSQTHCIMLMYTICSPANRSLHDVSVIISIPSLTGPSVPLHGLDSRQAGD